MSPRVVIIGGGLAGLAAATALATRNVRVTLLESRSRLGGRASSIVDRETGQTIDNCQHVVMGCCTNFFDWCQTIDCRDLFEPQPRLYFVGPPQRASRPPIATFEATSWMAPFHLAGALKRMSWISLNERRQLAMALLSLMGSKWSRGDESFAYWLSRQNQSPALIESFWKPVLISALSETLERTSLHYARKVFADGFIRHRDGWQVWIPKVPLDDIYGTRLMSWMQARGVDLKMNSGVASLESKAAILLRNYQLRRQSSAHWQCSNSDEQQADDQQFLQYAMSTGLVQISSVKLRDGTQLEADEFVLAVPQNLVAGLVPDELRKHETIRQLDQFKVAPIASVHLWFDRPITDLPHAVLLNRLSQWLFGRGHSERGYYYQVVISAAFDLDAMSEQQVLDQIVREIIEVWPQARDAQLLHGRMMTEHKAVFSPRPNIDAVRPASQSAIANLHLAGDWTNTGWPSTMEGAVKSGYLAAESVLKRLGDNTRFVQDDLPANWLTRWIVS